MQDLVVVEEMKESVSHMKQDQTVPKFYEFLIRHKNQDTKLFRVNVGIAQIMAPFGMFHPEILTVWLYHANVFGPSLTRFFTPV
jgi:hypothetical protein